MKNEQVYVLENFISEEDLLVINDFLINTEAQADSSGYSPFKTYVTGTSQGVTNCFSRIYTEIKSFIENSFECSVFDEGLSSVVELNVGDFMPLHLDHGSALNESVGLKTGSGHPTRDISSVLYYNDNYSGGEICFPNQNLVIKPKPGTFICFPAKDEFPHEVKMVTEGIRWCSTNFWCIKK